MLTVLLVTALALVAGVTPALGDPKVGREIGIARASGPFDVGFVNGKSRGAQRFFVKTAIDSKAREVIGDYQWICSGEGRDRSGYRSLPGRPGRTRLDLEYGRARRCSVVVNVLTDRRGGTVTATLFRTP